MAAQGPKDDDDALDTAALLDQGEQLLAESARLLRRLDAALRRRPDDGDGGGDGELTG